MRGQTQIGKRDLARIDPHRQTVGDGEQSQARAVALTRSPLISGSPGRHIFLRWFGRGG
jgi:hypothetical protein